MADARSRDLRIVWGFANLVALLPLLVEIALERMFELKRCWRRGFHRGPMADARSRDLRIVWGFANLVALLPLLAEIALEMMFELNRCWCRGSQRQLMSRFPF
jgi:hypothetical protein